MIARIKKDSQDNLTWERLTSAVVGSTPLGAVYGIWSTTVPDGFLPCNGAQFDKTQYPFLYSMLGDDHTPDLRECTLVGIGENSTDSLTTHNIYTLGKFKDANFSGATEAWTTLHPFDATNNTMTTVINTTGTDKVVTAKSATAGAAIFTPRSKGINYIIKAIPGNEVGEINQLEAQLALKISLEYVNALPTGDNIESNIYGYNGHYYIGDKEHTTLTQLVDNSDLTTLQPKTLDTSLTIGGQTITTVEAALSALNTVKTEKGINDVNALPVSPDIKDLIYRYNGNIYFGDSTNQTTALVNAASVDTVENGNMNPVTSNAVFDSLYLKGASATEILNVSRDTTVVGGTPYDYTTTATIPTDGWYKFQVIANMKANPGILTNHVRFSIGTVEVVTATTYTPEWNEKVNTVIIPVKAGTVVTYHAHCDAYAAGTNLTYRNWGSVYKIV